MIILERNWTWMGYRVVYFPSRDLAELTIDQMRSNDLVRIRQTNADLSDSPHMLNTSAFHALCIDLKSSIDQLRTRMDATTRRWLRKAEQLLDRVEIRRNDPSTCDDFISIYNSFAQMHGHSGPLSVKRLSSFLPLSDLFMAYHEGRPICGHVWLRDEVAGRLRLLFSCSSRLEGKDNAQLSATLNRYLHWHEMLLYKQEYFDTYDLGGFENQADSTHPLTQFKRSLGASVIRELNYCFGRGVAKLAFRLYETVPNMTAMLRGRLPA